MFDGRISFDGIATRQNFVVGSYCLTAFQSSANRVQFFSAVTASAWCSYERVGLLTQRRRSPKSFNRGMRIYLQATQKTDDLPPFKVQRNHRIGIWIVFSAPP
jgi:hypothetical protein